MGNDIGSGLSSMSICFDFRSTKVGNSVIGTRFDVITLQAPTLGLLIYQNLGGPLPLPLLRP